ncbi:4-oxalocrotonate tautomerase family protein [Paraburkholderia sp. BR13439]|uniref:tautomerase family protein n=1 Tax=unclassified Paraburkholderia TaxID=2615204 RepID=UPI00102056FF|nr:tautomerase family protein [Paraburkholderia sp. UYCP14C]RZF25759.1 4-oxalocrotonate tautomerase [Paraburkholderia sp. UYCP14C]
MPIIHVEMLAGRTLEQKSELAEALTRETVRITGCTLADVQIVFDERAHASWAIGGRLVSGHATAHTQKS